jgi:regulator of protease activity HflC (stomatin/prohibitin superfamily)
MTTFFINVLFIVAAFFIFMITGGVFFIVRQQTISIIERFGKFNRVALPGLNIKIPFIETIRGHMSLRIQQLDVKAEIKTKDNVFIKAIVAVQYRVKEDKLFDAFYKLTDHEEQIKSFVFDVVRSEVPKMILDDVFEKKDSIAIAVKTELSETMQAFGYEIVKALVTDIDPDAKVKAAMNEINEQQRLQMAAQAKGEAEKILKVKHAEAEAESKKLQGEGIANQRKAIIEGLRQSVNEFQHSVAGVTAADTMNMVLITQYFDTLKDIGANNKSSTILLPHSPGALKDIATQLQESIITANVASKSAE